MIQDHLLSNKTYDFLKSVVTIVLPFLAILYAVLAGVFGLSYMEAVVVTLAVLAALGGVLLSISTKSWNNSNTKYDGELITTGNDPVTGLPNLVLNINTDPNELVARNVVLLKSIDERTFF